MTINFCLYKCISFLLIFYTNVETWVVYMSSTTYSPFYLKVLNILEWDLKPKIVNS